MLKGFKTTIFNVILAIIGIVKVINPDAELPGEAEAEAAANSAEGLYVIGVAIVNQVLRALTNTPLFKKHS